MAAVATHSHHHEGQAPPLSPKELADIPGAPTVLSFSAEYDSRKREALSEPVPWDEYARAGLISAEDAAAIKTFDKSLVIGRKKMVVEAPEKYGPLFVRLLSTLSKDNTIKYLLSLIDEALNDSEGLTKHMHDMSATNAAFPYQPFVRQLDKKDIFTTASSCKILIYLLCSAPGDITLDVNPLLTYLYDHLGHAEPDVVDITLQNVQSLLSVTQLRLRIYDFNGGKIVSKLVELLGHQSSAQTQYQAAFCFWVLTLEKDIAREIQAKFEIVARLTDVLKGTTKEKVVRVVLATFRNLIHLAPHENTVPIVGTRVLPFLDTLKQRKYTDEEVLENLEFLEGYLRESLQRLSSFEEYQGEVLSGKLDWSPAHSSDMFWKQNVTKFNEHDHELLRALARLLMASADNLVLCVAAHDLGQYVKYYPNGRKFVQDIGAKHRLMEMMSHENADVRYQALIAVQKLMAQSWIV